MKALLLIALMSSAFAHEIKGTQLLEGSLKTKMMVKGIKVTCAVEVEKVKNLMEEDSYGNPAYKTRIDMGIKGSDDKKKIKVEISKRNVILTNLFKVGDKTEVRDLEYASEDGHIKLNINEEGRIKSVSLPHEGETINCVF